MSWSHCVALCRAVRCGEVVLMVGFPTAAGLYGMSDLTTASWALLGETVLGMLCFAVSIYALNSWCGRVHDARDPKFADSPLLAGRVRPGQLVAVVVLSLVCGVVVFALIAAGSVTPLVLMLVLWTGWALYSHPRGFKSVPFAGSALHLVAGAMMFLVPYMLQRPLDARGAVLAMVFALAFASGHANHEVMDRQADAAAGVRTTAVVLGARWVHGYGTVLALLAYAVAAGGWAAGELVWQEAVPFVVLGATHVAVGVYRFVRTLETRTARQYRRIYRVVFAAATVLTVLGHLSILVRGGG